MELSGAFTLAASPEKVWAALNDPAVLQRCIPGCESLTQTDANQLEAKMSAKIGPVKARFETTLTLSDIEPPKAYTLSGQGKGGAAGFAKGSARIELAQVDDGTELTYVVEMQVGGKLAQIGSRLVSGAARKIADQFFNAFNEEMTAA
jgi:uncharacterized protein